MKGIINMKNILIIESSPRIHGNSNTLCDQFEKGALESNNKVTKINLNKYQINFCKACQYCYSHDKCIQKDDANMIIELMMKADVIVFATPVYFYSVSGQLKTLFDRCCGCYTRMTNKEYYVILSAFDSNKKHLDKVIETIRGFTIDCIEDIEEKNIIYAEGCDNINDAKSHVSYDLAYNIGKSIK